MKAYKVRTRYAAEYDHPVEEIEVDRFTKESYIDRHGISRKRTNYYIVFEDKLEAIQYAKRMTLGDIARVEAELSKLQSRLAKIKAMEGIFAYAIYEHESVKQMRSAPANAVYIWRNTEFLEATRLAVSADRSDLEIYGIDSLNDGRIEMFCGQRLSGVVVDHAAKLTDEQQRNLVWMLNTRVVKKVAP
jgi:hypothetical protein